MNRTIVVSKGVIDNMTPMCDNAFFVNLAKMTINHGRRFSKIWLQTKYESKEN
jgi:hypothetical protein